MDQEKKNTFWERVTHEVDENIVTQESGGILGSGFNCGKCKKHPGHANFIPVSQFGKDSLSTSPVNPNIPLSEEEIVNWVKTCGDLVVRISGRKISHQRPEFRNNVQYPFARMRGRWVSNVGSGWVGDVEGPFQGSCSYGSCSQSSNSEFWELKIYTACHVVYGQEEAEHVEIVLFDEDSSGNGKESLFGGKMIEASLDGDYCWLSVHTHDQVLADKVRQMRQARGDMRRRLDHKFAACSSSLKGKIPLFAIGHPHGRMKYITVGSFDAKSDSSLTYEVPTCPGNSGGPILPIGLESGKDRYLVCHPHSGAVSKQLGESASWSLRW